MPDPDIPPVILDDDYIKDIKDQMPVMPAQWRQQLIKLGLTKAAIETLLDGEVEFPEAKLLSTLKTSLEDDKAYARSLANWTVNILIPHYRENEVTANDLTSRQKKLKATYLLVQNGELSSTNARVLVLHVSDSTELNEDIKIVAQAKGLIQVSDETEINKIVEQVLSQNTKAVEDVKKGEMKAIGFLVGQVMKLSQGKANPSLAQGLIKKQLSL